MLVPWDRQLVRDAHTKARLRTSGRAQTCPSALLPLSLLEAVQVLVPRPGSTQRAKTLPGGLFSADFT